MMIDPEGDAGDAKHPVSYDFSDTPPSHGGSEGIRFGGDKKGRKPRKKTSVMRGR